MYIYDLDVAFTSCLPALISPYWLPLGYKLFPLFIVLIFQLFIVVILFILFIYCYFPLMRLFFVLFLFLLFLIFYFSSPLGHQLCVATWSELVLLDLICSRPGCYPFASSWSWSAQTLLSLLLSGQDL